MRITAIVFCLLISCVVIPAQDVDLGGVPSVITWEGAGVDFVAVFGGGAPADAYGYLSYPDRLTRSWAYEFTNSTC